MSSPSLPFSFSHLLSLLDTSVLTDKLRYFKASRILKFSVLCSFTHIWGRSALHDVSDRASNDTYKTLLHFLLVLYFSLKGRCCAKTHREVTLHLRLAEGELLWKPRVKMCLLSSFEQLVNEVKVKFLPETELREHRIQQRARRRGYVEVECQ